MNETVWVPMVDLPMRVDVPDVTLEDLRGERDRARATAVQLEQQIAAALKLADDLDASKAACRAKSPDCSCSYKDCYDHGMWHDCDHDFRAPLRLALGGGFSGH